MPELQVGGIVDTRRKTIGQHEPCRNVIAHQLQYLAVGIGRAEAGAIHAALVWR